ncbi:MAG TPA: ferredoxin [Candidatus Limnocylindrales bacterium]|nr:ferredoxin [Candidatus Limnocylindrales bacterium]
MASPRGRRTELVVDRIACDGFGMCAELLPELIDLDDWGYPIVRDGGVPDVLLEHARRAVAVCPVLALRLRSVAAAAPAVGAVFDQVRARPAIAPNLPVRSVRG